MAFVVLIKFGQRDHLEQFREKGLLYMQHLSAFAALENDELRGDRFEGTNRIIQPHAIGKITVTDAESGKVVEIGPADLAGPVLWSFGPEVDCNVFCMFAVSKPIDGDVVDTRNLGFGDSFVIVLNTQEFIDRVVAAAAAQKRSIDCRLVEYFDVRTHSGDTGPFRKPNLFAHQQEFRITARPGQPTPLLLSVGNIANITSPVHALREINQITDFSGAAAQLAGLDIS